MKTFKKIVLEDLIRSDLKRIIPKIVSIRHEKYSGGNSLRIKTINLMRQDREAFKSLLEKYKDGHFDGMQDLYIYKKGPEQAERVAKYVFLNNEFDDEIKEKVKTDLRFKYGVTDDESAQRVFKSWYDSAVHQTLQELGEF